MSADQNYSLFSPKQSSDELVHGTIMWSTAKPDSYNFELIVLHNSRTSIYHLEKPYSEPKEHQNYRAWTSVMEACDVPESFVAP